MHTTNYKNTFIEVAEDCPALSGEMPPIRGAKKSIANLQFEMLFENPYAYTSDEILFSIFALRKKITKSEMDVAKDAFFSKGQPCFRTSPLAKRYGWGIHSNEKGKIAIFARESDAYQKFVNDESVAKKKAMRSRR